MVLIIMIMITPPPLSCRPPISTPARAGQRRLRVGSCPGAGHVRREALLRRNHLSNTKYLSNTSFLQNMW